MSDLIEPNNDHVICPHCANQFRAIPVNVQTRIADLEAENARLKSAAETWHNRNRDNCQRLNDKIAVVGAARESAEQEVARLTAHIRAVANYHDGLKYSLLDGVRSPAWELHHTERRDFALSGLEGK